jgi:exodeoxyribonuclease V alpha subunit
MLPDGSLLLAGIDGEPLSLTSGGPHSLVKALPNRSRLILVEFSCSMNRGSLGVRELNTALQRVLNPARSGEPAVERFGWRFQKGDKIIQTENNHDKDVLNGDIGSG